jgi:hypothetical protein
MTGHGYVLAEGEGESLFEWPLFDSEMGLLQASKRLMPKAFRSAGLGGGVLCGIFSRFFSDLNNVTKPEIRCYIFCEM